ncbi:MAG: hypothetical protein ACE5IZ_04870 [Dehalococcoidia bacterium]
MATARQRWGQRFRAPEHPDNGLSLYYWLRLGYRPARSSDFRGALARDGCLWMVRVNL